VKKEMDSFVEAAADMGSSLYLSYPSNGLLYKAGGDVRDTLERHFPTVKKVASEPLRHSTLGGAPGMASIMVTEDVYYGGW
jgi:hypothetical protein